MKVFITGVTSGIGLETAKALFAMGHEVWGIGRREQSDEIQSDKFHYTQCDVADAQQVEAVIQEMKKMSFVPDTVVLNSAIFLRDLNAGFDFPSLRTVFEVNFFGAMIWVDKFLPVFLNRGVGRFIAVSSTTVFRPTVDSASLSASKASLSSAFRSLSLRFSQSNVNFANVYFGPVATPMVPEYTGKKTRQFFVMSSARAGEKLASAVLGSKNVYYFPYWIILLLRVVWFLPDSFFSKVSHKIKNK